MFHDAINQSNERQISSLIQKTIVIPEGLEVISGPNAGVGGEVFLDPINNKAYRRLDFARHPADKEGNIADFYRKLEVSKSDTTGLTPHIFSYDPETYTLEMELIKGTSFLENISITSEVAENFLKKLNDFHNLGLYHGDLMSRNHWFLTPQNEIRLIDPIDMATSNPDSGNTVSSIQAMDKAIALIRLKEVGYTPPIK